MPKFAVPMHFLAQTLLTQPRGQPDIAVCALAFYGAFVF
jgi:hypothetical protein